MLALLPTRKMIGKGQRGTRRGVLASSSDSFPPESHHVVSEFVRPLQFRKAGSRPAVSEGGGFKHDRGMTSFGGKMGWAGGRDATRRTNRQPSGTVAFFKCDADSSSAVVCMYRGVERANEGDRRNGT